MFHLRSTHGDRPALPPFPDCHTVPATGGSVTHEPCSNGTVTILVIVMNEDYRLAGALIAAALALLIGAGVITTTGLGAGALPGPEVKATENSSLETYNVTVGTGALAAGEDTTVWVEQNPNRTETEHEVGNRTVVLNEDDRDELFEDRSRAAFVETVWKRTASEADFEADSRIEVRVDQGYESVDRDRPTGEAFVTVSPEASRLPEVRATVDLSNETVTVTRVLPELGAVDLDVTDEIDRLEAEDEALLERIVERGGEVSYQVQREFEDPDSLTATVVEASADGDVDVHLSHPEQTATTVGLTLDLERETVENSWVVMEIDSSNLQTANASENGTVEFESG